MARSAVFLAWGAFWLGGVQYFIYVELFARRLFPSAAAFVAKPVRERLADPAGLMTVGKQVALDQFVHHPFFLFPAFYCVKEFIEAGRLGGEQLSSALCQKYRQHPRLHRPRRALRRPHRRVCQHDPPRPTSLAVITLALRRCSSRRCSPPPVARALFARRLAACLTPRAPFARAAAAATSAHCAPGA